MGLGGSGVKIESQQLASTSVAKFEAGRRSFMESVSQQNNEELSKWSGDQTEEISQD